MSERISPHPHRLRVLFLCTHNSSRSQMAEGLLRARGGAAYEVFSAGTQPSIVHPLAIKVMREIGIDISQHRAKSLQEFCDQPPMDLVVTVCYAAAEACPYIPNARYQVHWDFPDPSRIEGSEAERLAAFRHIRDLIAARINQFLGQQPASSLAELYAAAKVLEEPS
jgi:arsenate reductase